MLERMKLSTRIIVLGLMPVILFGSLFFWLLPKLKQRMYEAKYATTRNVVEGAWSVASHYEKLSSSGEMDVEQAKKAAMSALGAMRYGGNEYFWINDLEPRMIMHPMQTALNGTSLVEKADPNGKRLFVEMANICRAKGEGFVDYMWPKGNNTVPVPKISYVKLLKNWSWVIGSGIYIDDVEREVGQVYRAIIIAASIITFLCMGLALFMARSIAVPVVRIAFGIESGADQVTSASGHVSQASQSLAEGASEQASNIEEISSSLEELTAMTRQNAQNSSRADSMVRDIDGKARECGVSMDRLGHAVKEIHGSAEETVKIIRTIDEIAFQTNLLALNAAVEAARAGDAGKGFAVVAEEVRNLAQRSAQAAKTTAEIITGSLANSEKGVQATEQVRGIISQISQGIEQVTHIIGEVSAASGEQSKGIDQINQGVAQLNSVTQENAATAEETAATTEELSAQADTLNEMVIQLKCLVEGRKSSDSRNATVSGSRSRSTAF
jgi:methyl-accepting chemotaxis protein